MFSNPVRVGSHIYVIDGTSDRAGAVVCIEAGTGKELSFSVGEGSLFRANQSWTPPVVSGGLVYVRQTKRERFGEAPPRLLCYDLRAGR
ncbi:MAG: hypothetical protein GY711_00835 [bacterium]|nr:hypothetical protein [bacterium]